MLIAKHSIIHQDILQKGRVNALIGVLLYQGVQRWGQPNEGEKVAIEAISNPERLERMSRNILIVSSWDDLLAIE